MPMNPFGCGNQQFSKKRVWYIQMWINLGWILLALLMIPLFLVFFVPIVMIAVVLDGPLRRHRRNFCKKLSHFLLVFFVCLFLFSLGMALNVIAIPLMIVIGIPVALTIMIIERRKKHRIAEQNLKEIMEGKR
jgi:hypothetical protein